MRCRAKGECAVRRKINRLISMVNCQKVAFLSLLILIWILIFIPFSNRLVPLFQDGKGQKIVTSLLISIGTMWYRTSFWQNCMRIIRIVSNRLVFTWQTLEFWCPAQWGRFRTLSRGSVWSRPPSYCPYQARRATPAARRSSGPWCLQILCQG